MHRATACAAGRLLVTQRRTRLASAPVRVTACAVPPSHGRSGRDAPPASTNGILVRLRGAHPARYATAVRFRGARPDATPLRPAALVGPPRCSAGRQPGTGRRCAQRGAGDGAAAPRRRRGRATCCQGCALPGGGSAGVRRGACHGGGGYQGRTRSRCRRPPARCLAARAPQLPRRFSNPDLSRFSRRRPAPGIRGALLAGACSERYRYCDVS